MTWNAKTRRRWFGALCLIAAVVLLIAGETSPKPGASAPGFIGYWLACFLFAVFAMVAAILDVSAVSRAAHDEQRALFEKTLNEIQVEKQRRSGGDRTQNSGDFRD